MDHQFRQSERDVTPKLVCVECGGVSQGNVSCDEGDICDACHARDTGDLADFDLGTRTEGQMERFNATIEILQGQSAAIVTLTDSRGEWSGSCRITGRDLYERGYATASVNAALKGGMVETYRVS